MKYLSVKQALCASLLSMLLCVAMLVGSTFAWFTDTAKTAVNTIKAGTLDVELWQADADAPLEARALQWVAADGRAQEAIYWEPGCSYDLEGFRIKNNGNLALKYQVVITGIVGSAKLLEVLDFTVTVDGMQLVAKDGTSAVATAADLNEFEGTLGADDVTGTIRITGRMQTTAGNGYMGEQIEGITITVYATQDAVEQDSNNNRYDESASLPVSQEQLDLALSDATIKTITVPAGSGMQLTNNTVLQPGVTLTGEGREKTILRVEKTTVKNNDVTLRDMTINGAAPAGNDGALNVGGKNTVLDNITFNGQGFNGDTKAIAVTGENFAIRNSKVTGAFRGIIFWDNIGGDNLIENCVIDNVIYTFNINAASVKPGTTLTARNSTLNGWTSYSGCMTLVTFENCDLGKSNGYAYLVAYADSVFTGCTFHDGYQIGAGQAGVTLTFADCVLEDGTAITAENFAEKLGDVDADMRGCTVIVNGITVAWN